MREILCANVVCENMFQDLMSMSGSMVCSPDPVLVFHENMLLWGINQDYISRYKNFFMTKWDEPFSNLPLVQNSTCNINEQINIV